MNIKRNITFQTESRKKDGVTNKLKQSAAEINADLSKYENDIQEIFKRFEVAEAMPTTEQVREAFNAKIKASQMSKFDEF